MDFVGQKIEFMVPGTTQIKRRQGAMEQRTKEETQC